MMPRGALISKGYVEEQKILHARPNGYGGKGDKWTGGVASLITDLRASSVLDYGCGQGSLVKALRPMVSGAVRLDEYDPAIPGKDGPPEFADLVVCTDVLEHIEPERLGAVLAHLQMLTRKAALIVTHLGPANKVLADGRNAHLIQKPAAWWWAEIVSAGFEVCEWDPRWPVPLKVGPIIDNPKHYICVVTPC